MGGNLAFGDVGELVIALGDIDQGKIRYMPDSLLVTESRLSALSYQPQAALSPAWTSP